MIFFLKLLRHGFKLYSNVILIYLKSWKCVRHWNYNMTHYEPCLLHCTNTIICSFPINSLPSLAMTIPRGFTVICAYLTFKMYIYLTIYAKISKKTISIMSHNVHYIFSDIVWLFICKAGLSNYCDCENFNLISTS